MVKHLKIALVLLFCSATALGLGGWSSRAQEMPAEKVFKNIQVLRGIPASQITVLMDNFNKALGVDCDYCHTMGALEKADKPAHKMSLQMVKMTRDINQRYGIAVDCQACHQGQKKPPHLGKGMGFGPAGLGSGGGKDLVQPVETKPPATTTTTAAAAATSAEPEPPGLVSFKASYGAVAFDHGQHMNVSDCATCHHTGENNKCTTCHQKAPSAITKIRAQDAAHNRNSQRACAGCHLKSQAGPTKCAECHKK